VESLGFFGAAGLEAAVLGALGIGGIWGESRGDERRRERADGFGVREAVSEMTRPFG
jgi:hypothetical protein